MRRREERRPRVRLPDGGDVLAEAEAALHDATPHVAGGADAVANAVLEVLAWLALNDERQAGRVLRTVAPLEGAAAAVCAGIWAAWRGVALPGPLVREAALAWLRSDPPAADAWSEAARSLGEVVAEMAGERELLGMLRGERQASWAAALADIGTTSGGVRPAARAAAGVVELVHGRLGVEPDATRGRLRLAPTLAAGTTRAERLAVGDAQLSLHATVAGADVSIEVEQTSGAMPLTVVLEPAVPGFGFRSARVDGGSAQLDVDLTRPGVVRPRVQLVVDRPRLLSFEVEAQ